MHESRFRSRSELASQIAGRHRELRRGQTERQAVNQEDVQNSSSGVMLYIVEHPYPFLVLFPPTLKGSSRVRVFPRNGIARPR